MKSAITILVVAAILLPSLALAVPTTVYITPNVSSTFTWNSTFTGSTTQIATSQLGGAIGIMGTVGSSCANNLALKDGTDCKAVFDSLTQGGGFIVHFTLPAYTTIYSIGINTTVQRTDNAEICSLAVLNHTASTYYNIKNNAGSTPDCKAGYIDMSYNLTDTDVIDFLNGGTNLSVMLRSPWAAIVGAASTNADMLVVNLTYEPVFIVPPATLGAPPSLDQVAQILALIFILLFAAVVAIKSWS